MHECPKCGQACCCNGDIDDCSVMTARWVYGHCECCDEEFDEGHEGYEWH